MVKKNIKIRVIDVSRTVEKTIKILEQKNSYFITSVYFKKEDVKEILIPLLKISSKLKFKEKLHSPKHIFSYLVINSLKSTLNKLNDKMEVNDETSEDINTEVDNSSNEISGKT